jgi:hypothetical protein
VQFFNTPLATIFGGELFAEYDLNEYLTAFAVSSYVEGTDQDRKQSGQLPDLFFPTTPRVPLDLPSVGETPDTEPLPGIPPWDNRIRLRLHDPSPSPAWGTEVSARIVDQQDRVATTLRELPTPGFTTYDIRSGSSTKTRCSWPASRISPTNNTASTSTSGRESFNRESTTTLAYNSFTES